MDLFLKHFLFACATALASLTAGIVNTYYSPAKPTLVRDLRFTDFEANLFNTFGLFFASVGAIVAKLLLRFAGRRLSTFLNNAVAAASYMVLAVAKAKPLAFAMRAIQGITTGVNSAVTPMYLLETAPPEYRGTFSGFHQAFSNIGLAYTFFIGLFCEWRHLSWLCTIFSLLLCVVIWFVPQSRVTEGKMNFSQMLRKQYIPKVFHGLALICIQQFSGINAVLTNMSQIFESAHSSLKPGIASLIATLASVPSCFLGSWLVDKIGCRKTFIISLITACLAHLMFWMQDLFGLDKLIPVVAIFVYMVAFGTGLGPVVWICIPELFEDIVRSGFVSGLVLINWGIAGGVAYLWPLMEKNLGLGWSFFAFAAVCVLGIVYTKFLMPEMRGEEVVEEAPEQEEEEEEAEVVDEGNPSAI
jgi:MFS family permease